ncbi:PREDICTED: uncharacterized protein LOC106344549 [Brassica oleracea var. oleracea]|uniref:uncharacterized protein LOC106344549 n=1 Tax=Brassica oleracea var. oleracea TaxID=109376 RepID=UPI0006A6B927|nr:PREDICTED: uncharacterized protein LOC106344549 [Brassica oleracea var. oleracea]
MDSYPSSHTSKFVDLLNSLQSISFGNYEDSVSQASSQAVGTEDGGETGTQRRERRKWTPADDIVLISSWLNTSKDVMVSNEQKSSTFWSRVAAYFAASRQDAYEAASREKTSGQNENDVLKLAHQMFYTNHNKKFFLEYAWKELRNDQKCVKTVEILQALNQLKRPPGVKASKARGKKPVAEEKAMKEFETMWSIRQQDLAQKERLSKMRLLDSRIAKKEPLVEYEEELKKKLINELLLS